MTDNTAMESTRVSALADRHRALGSNLGDWNGMGVPWDYAADACDEHDAVREAAGLFDVSGLKKIHVRGADSDAVVDHVITRNMAKIGIGRSAYGPVLTEGGTIADDAIIAHMGENDWLVIHGSGGTMAHLEDFAAGKRVDIEFDDVLHDISLQGPKALELLNAHTPIDLTILSYFHQRETELFSHKCVLSRTGYSGEWGCEIFANADVIVDLWDQILGHGETMGVLPCSFTCLDKVRVEAALLFYPYDMTEQNTPWEVDLGWAIARSGADFRGKAAVLAAEGKEKVKLAGIVINHDEALAGGEKLLQDGREVGVVNSPAYSHRMRKSLALCHVTSGLEVPGTRLAVEGEDISTTAIVERIPFYDPEKTRTHAG